MKILVSSGVLAQKLCSMEDIVHAIHYVSYDKGKGKLYLKDATGDKIEDYSVECEVEPQGSEGFHYVQYHARWDWVMSLVREVEDQPISLNIGPNKVQVIFEY